jgi:uncharacterized protein YndB with AHSA1/START domain
MARQNLRRLAAGTALAIVLMAAQSAAVHAAVTDQQATGFAIEETALIAASPDKVYAALLEPAKWWNPRHTFSGNAANLTLDAKAGGCLCETLPNGGSALHLTVVDVEPGSTLRLRGPMGPFQAEGVESALTFTLKADGIGTALTLDNNAGGYMKGGFGKWPALADGMLSDLVMRLQRYVETGAK